MSKIIEALKVRSTGPDKEITVEKSGHALFFSDHETVNRHIAEFLAELRR